MALQDRPHLHRIGSCSEDPRRAALGCLIHVLFTATSPLNAHPRMIRRLPIQNLLGLQLTASVVHSDARILAFADIDLTLGRGWTLTALRYGTEVVVG